MNYKKPTKAIITDAGFASRFLPLTKTMPKGMLPMGGKPAMQICIEECVEAGIQEIIIVATPGTMGKTIYEDYFTNPLLNAKELLEKQGKSDRYEAIEKVLNFPKITVIEQDPALPYGTAAPIVSARNLLASDEAFLSIQADDIVFGASDAKTMIETFEKNPDIAGVIIGQEVSPSVVDKYGMIVMKNGNELDHIVEKPAIGTEPSLLASYGRYLLTPDVFQFFDETGLDGELWQVDGITKLAKYGRVIVEPTKGQWMTTGDPKNYFLATLDYALKNNPEWIDDIRKTGHGEK